MSRLRVAIAGYGAVAEIHARALAERPDVELVAVVGPRRERALEFAGRHGVARVFAALPDAFGAVHPHAVVIASPTDLHPVHAQQAVEAGVHTLVEFPLVDKPDRLEALFNRAQADGVVVATAHTSRFIWAFREARAIIAAGTVGQVRAVHYLRLMNRPVGTGAEGRTRTWTDDVLLHHAGHALDLLLFWFGTQVKLVEVVSPRTAEGRRNVGLLLDGPGACPMTAALSYDASAHSMQVDVIAEKGTIRIDGFARLRVNQQEYTHHRPADDDAAYQASIREQDQGFVDALRGGAAFPVPAKDTLALNTLLTQAESLCSGATQGESTP